MSLTSQIHQAAAMGDLEEVKALLNDKPELVQSRDDRGSTPLHEAVSGNRAEVVRLLLERNADVRAVDMIGQTPLHRALMFGNRQIADLLLAHSPDIHARDKESLTPLHFAARSGNAGLVEILLAANAEVNCRGADGVTPLHYAMAGGENVAELLLAHGATCDATTGHGWTPLHGAAGAGFTRIVTILLAKGADVSVRDYRGTIPLHWAASRNHPNVAEVLLANGSDVNAKDYEGLTPLHWFARKRREFSAELLARISGGKTIIEVLLARNADFDARDNNNRTPFDTALQIGQGDFAELLLRHPVSALPVPPTRNPSSISSSEVNVLTFNKAEDYRKLANGRIMRLELPASIFARPALYYLGVRSKADHTQLVKFAQGAGPFRLMPRSLEVFFLSGIQLKEAQHPPLELPVSKDLHLFQIIAQSNSRNWEQAKQDKVISVLWDNAVLDLSDPQISFYSINHLNMHPDFYYRTCLDGSITITQFTHRVADNDITIPDTVDGKPVQCIDANVFYSGIFPRRIMIPRGVTTIADAAFRAFHSVRTVTVDELNPIYGSMDGVLVDKQQVGTPEYMSIAFSEMEPIENVPHCVVSRAELPIDFFEPPHLYYLGIKTCADHNKLVKWVECFDSFKVMPRSLECLRLRRVRGIQLMALRGGPPGLPAFSNLLYFRLFLTSYLPRWEQVKHDKAISVLWHNQWPDLSDATMALFKRSHQ